jgi:glc operon protein GlcG
MLLFLFLYFITLPVNAQVTTKKAITLELAKKIAAAAEAEALKNKLTMVITIIDDGGNLVYLEKMDNTQLGSIEVALEKAHTALFFKRPSKVYEDMVTNGRNTIIGIRNIIPIEGGLPLVVDEQIIGAIGVSGGTPQQDGSIAKAGIEVLSTRIDKK